jgi:hypothetical protein
MTSNAHCRNLRLEIWVSILQAKLRNESDIGMISLPADIESMPTAVGPHTPSMLVV